MKVKGQALLVSYEDQANPHRVYRVVAAPSPTHPFDFELVDLETGAVIYSDLRQCGWRKVGLR